MYKITNIHMVEAAGMWCNSKRLFLQFRILHPQETSLRSAFWLIIYYWLYTKKAKEGPWVTWEEEIQKILKERGNELLD